MRIRKVSQLAGFVGTVSNSHSDSNSDTYSCSYINSIIEKGSVEDAGNNWKKVDMGFARFYFRNDTIASTTYAGNGWGALASIYLPTNVTFDSSKMSFSSSIKADDNAILCNLCMYNGANYLYTGWNNKYGGNVTTVIRYNLVLIDFS